MRVIQPRYKLQNNNLLTTDIESTYRIIDGRRIFARCRTEGVQWTKDQLIDKMLLKFIKER